MNYDWSTGEHVTEMAQPPAREYDYNGMVESDMGEIFKKMYSNNNQWHKSLEHCAR